MSESQAPEPTRLPRLTRLVFWAWLGYWLLLFTLMHLPKPPGAHLTERIGDKIVHAGAYFVLVALGGWFALRRGRRIGVGWAARWWVIYALYAALDEWLQQYVNRFCEFGDWLADVVGALLALGMLVVLSGRAGYRIERDQP